MQLKFRSGINKILVAFIVALNIVMLLLFSTKIFTTSLIGVKAGFFFLALDFIFILPMLFFTYYQFKDDYLYIHDYPFRAYKIKYEDIFNVEDGDFETRNKRIVALSLDRIAIGYKKVNSKNEEEDWYIYISPADMNLFLIRLSGRIEGNKKAFEEKAKELSEKQLEHEKKKKQAEEKRKRLEEEQKPEIIKVSEVKKFSSFKAKAVENESDGSEKTDAEDGYKRP